MNRAVAIFAALISCSWCLVAQETRPATDSRPAVREGTIRGRVVDERHQPIAHAKVKVSRSSQSTRQTVAIPLRTTPRPPPRIEEESDPESRYRTIDVDADGAFRAQMASDGQSWVQVTAKGFSSAFRGGLEPDGPELEIVLKAGTSLRGRVVSAHGSTPIPDARIGAGQSGGSSRSLPDGSFVIEDLPSPIGWIRATHPDYLTTEIRGAPVDQGTGVTIVLDPGRAVSGVVADAATRTPVGGARVSAGAWQSSNWMGERWKSATTDSTGAFTVKGLPPSLGYLAVESPGYVTRSIRLDLSDGSGVRSLGAVSIDPGATLRLRLIDEEGLPVAAAAVGCGEVTTTSDPSGEVILDGLDRPADGRYPQVQVRAPGFETRQTEAPKGSDGAESRPAIVLQRATAELSGHVVDQAGAPLARARVSASGAANLTATSDQEGRFRFTSVPAGRWNLSAWERGCDSPGGIDRTIDRGETASGIELKLTRVLQIEGRVVDRAGQAIHGAMISPSKIDPPGLASVRGGSTSKDGRFWIRVPVQAAPRHFRVSAAGFEEREVDLNEHLQGKEGMVVLDPLPDAARMTGVVVDAKTREPVKDADVSLTRLSRPRLNPDPWDEQHALVRQQAKTGADGKFSLLGPAGLVRLHVETRDVEPRRYVDLERDVVLDSHGSSVTLELSSGMALFVYLPASGAGDLEALLLPEAGAWYGRTRREEYQAEYGCFAFWWLEPGPHRLAIIRRGEPSNGTAAIACLREAVMVGPESRTKIKLELEPMGTLVAEWPGERAVGAESRPAHGRVEVISRTGRPLDVWNRPERPLDLMTSSSFGIDAGGVRRRRLPPGEYLVRFHHDALTAAEQTVVVKAGEETRIEFRPR